MIINFLIIIQESMKKYYLNDVYGISRDVPLNYVARSNVDEKFKNNLNRQKHITIFGSSKQGKTCLRKQCLKPEEYILVQCSNKWSLSDLNSNILKRAGYELEISSKTSVTGKAKIIASIKACFGIGEANVGSELENTENYETTKKQLELDVDDVNDVIAALKMINFSKIIVLEDFHYLKSEVQKDFAIELKAFHENSKYCFVIVGVWLDENKLVIYNGDLTGRVVSVNADLWSNSDLNRVIDTGADLLNITFSSEFKEQLLQGCSDNVYLVQEACQRICYENEITETQIDNKVIGNGDDAKRLMQEIIREQSGRYNAFITNYANGFQETTLEMHKWLLYPIISATKEELTEGLSYRSIRLKLADKHPRGNELNPGNLTQALKAVVSLQLSKSIQPIIIDYDESNLKLHVVDKGFIIWLSVQDKNELFDMADLPHDK